jgi:DNA-binding LacI/PurR family transcriptional regulator
MYRILGIFNKNAYIVTEHGDDMRLEEMNCSIPDRVRVASFYNSIQLESHNPPITVLSIDVKELGMSAGKHLIQMISGETVDHKSLINYEIVLKRSTS